MKPTRPDHDSPSDTEPRSGAIEDLLDALQTRGDPRGWTRALVETAELLEQLADRCLHDAKRHGSLDGSRRARACRERARLWREAASEIEDGTRRKPRRRASETRRRRVPEPVAVDPASRRLLERAAKIARMPSSVLITGETGVGKEVFARWLHRHSTRADGPFVAVDCGAIPDNLACSELFGHEPGAFSGATESRIGYFEAASGGTLLLDEIGELSVETQARLLRVLEERRVRRLGSTETIAVDVRILAATHRDLERRARDGEFRSDLLYRLDVLRLEIPPLRDRPADLDALADAFVRELAPDAALTEDARKRLRAHPWPGNVRELRNVLERTLALRGDRSALTARDLLSLATERSGPHDLDARVAQIEREALLEALAACDGNQARAAERLGLTRRAFVYRLRKHGL